jgi:hypothetical protein
VIPEEVSAGAGEWDGEADYAEILCCVKHTGFDLGFC